MLNIFWIIRLRIFRLYIWMRRISIYLFQGKKGRSKKGNRSICIATGSKGSNIHLIGCIGNIGLIHHKIKRGSFKKPGLWSSYVIVCEMLKITMHLM